MILVRVLVMIMILGMAVTAAGCGPSSSASGHTSPRNPFDTRAWQEGSSHGPWHLVFDGYGAVTGNDREVRMVPRSADSLDSTHACLVLTNDEYPGDIDFSITVRTEEQVRADAPNPWEVGWVLWNYRDNDHFYALALKPNGWELSKQDTDYPGNQRFLASGRLPRFPLNEDHRARVVQEGNTITVYAEDTLLGTYTDTETPYSGGRIGLYTEDAMVRFSDLEIHATEKLE
ncbi:MAG: calcium-binding protein [Corynebacterium humireducens]|jgi:hypothetical protein|uniref:Calcium-binding protein n=1 Tax=Corynebacterium humireducens TaxID=1223514 RepID=A0A7X6PLP6_9CORY|nr:calcium-binding protein [Corynebacterium humireducens]